MDELRRIQDFEHLKLLADARRLKLLRLLMAAPATLSQLGQMLGEHPARVRHHIKLLERAGLIDLVDQRLARGFVEKYYRARAQTFLLQQLILPANTSANTIVIIGSHDLALEALANRVESPKNNPLQVFIVPVGSLDGLINLRQGLGHMAGSHLYDVESDEYNIPSVRRLFPDRAMTLITLAHRTQGLMVATGNPLQIRGMEDLGREEITLVNRNRGSGTRLWLDRRLQILGVSAANLGGYAREVRTHTALAEIIQAGKADVGLGLQAAAIKFGLDFIPLYQERFDLIIPNDLLETAQIQTWLNLLNSAAIQDTIAALPGYDTTHTGDRVFP
jgi:putative molybdopterin biosynthesis protein